MSNYFQWDSGCPRGLRNLPFVNNSEWTEAGNAVVKRASSKGGQGRRAAREAKQTTRWSWRTGGAELRLALAEGIQVVAYLLLNRRPMPG